MKEKKWLTIELVVALVLTACLSVLLIADRMRTEDQLRKNNIELTAQQEASRCLRCDRR